MIEQPLAFHLVIIGDEILSGKRQDKHLAQTLALLSARHLRLASVTYLPDDEQQIAQRLVELKQRSQPVLVCGGIGATPDDHTRQAAARAFNSELRLHPQAKALIIAHINALAASHAVEPDLQLPANQQRLRLGEFPAIANIIPCSISYFPGFYCEQCYFFPGFPRLAQDMLQWVLDNRYAKRHNLIIKEYSVATINVFESAIIPILEQVERQHNAVKTFSLPAANNCNQTSQRIEIGVRGQEEKALLALQELIALLEQHNIAWQK